MKTKALLQKNIFVFVIILFCLSARDCQAQSSVYAYWFYRSVANAPVLALSMAADGLTNSWVVGRVYSSTVVSGNSLSSANGWPNLFVAKFKHGSTNAPQWIKSPSSDNLVSNGKIGCDLLAGGCYFSGNFAGTNLTFGSTVLTNYGMVGDYLNDVFLVKYDTAGTFKFLKQAGGTDVDTLGDAVTDTSGNTYLTGTFQSPVFFAASSNLVRQSASGGDCFTMKYDSNGNLLWLESGSYASASCIALDSGNSCYVGGAVLGASVFRGNSPANQTTTNFLAKYTSAGVLSWIRGDVAIGKFIRVDKATNIFTVGTYSNVIQIGTITLSNNVSSTVFVAKYDADGNALWATQLPGLGGDVVTGMALDSKTNCWVTGYFQSPSTPTNPVGFVARFDPAGELTASSKGDRNQTSMFNGVAMGSSGSVIPLVCGTYSTNFTFGKTVFQNSGNQDLFSAWCMISPAMTAQTTTTNIVLSWSAADSVGYQLQTNSDLNSANWNNSGGAVQVGSQIYSTNSAFEGARFFRLRKP